MCEIECPGCMPNVFRNVCSKAIEALTRLSSVPEAPEHSFLNPMKYSRFGRVSCVY